MDFVTGKRIFEASLSLDATFGEMDVAISQIADEEERKIWAMRLGNILRAVNEEMIIPIVQLYPELEGE